MNETREKEVLTESSKAVAYLSEGQLWEWRGNDHAPEQIRCESGSRLKERLLKMKQKHEWKTQGNGASFMGGAAL